MTRFAVYPSFSAPSLYLTYLFQRCQYHSTTTVAPDSFYLPIPPYLHTKPSSFLALCLRLVFVDSPSDLCFQSQTLRWLRSLKRLLTFQRHLLRDLLLVLSSYHSRLPVPPPHIVCIRDITDGTCLSRGQTIRFTALRSRRLQQVVEKIGFEDLWQ